MTDDSLVVLIVLYAIGFVITAAAAGTQLYYSTAREDRRQYARAILAAPVWPLIFVWWVIEGLRWLIREAK